MIALREFVPGNRLYANRGTYYVSRYHLGAEQTSNLQVLRVNADRTSIAEQAGNAAPGQTGGQSIPAMPLTDLDLAHESRITEDELLRFSMPVSVLGRLRKKRRSGTAYKIGQSEVDHLRGQGIELANIGEAGRVKAGELGYLICSVCGAAKTPYAVPDEISHFLQVHTERCGKAPVPLAVTVQADVDMLRFRNVNDQAKGVNIGEALRTAAVRLLDMGQEDLQLLLVEHADRKIDLLIYDPMPGGSGLLEQMLARWRELVTTAKSLLAECPGGCDKACYSCLKTFRNQFYHEALDRKAALGYIVELDHEPDGYRLISPMEGDRAAVDAGPSNVPEARLVQLLRDHYFPSGKCRQSVVTTINVTTTPDWLHEESKVAIYLDGMSRSLHGDPRTAQQDQIRRLAMESDGYRVIVIQSRDLNDPEALRLHLRNIAQAMGRADLVEALAVSGPIGGDRPTQNDTVAGAGMPSSPSSAERQRHAEEVLSYCDERCRGLVRACMEHSRLLPEVGFELQDGSGCVCAEAELAWPHRKLAVVLPERGDATEAFRGQGWEVFTAGSLTVERLLDLLSE